jgi:hypothetical protein
MIPNPEDLEPPDDEERDDEGEDIKAQETISDMKDDGLLKPRRNNDI